MAAPPLRLGQRDDPAPGPGASPRLPATPATGTSVQAGRAPRIGIANRYA